MAYQINHKKSLETLIRNSIGSKFFKSVYFNVGGEIKDILKKGDLSCAFYVSTVLKIIGLISNIHATVLGTIKDLESSGWYQIKNPKKFAVVVWDSDKKHKHLHIGICINKNLAVDNSSKLKSPQIHKINHRKIKALYFHPNLE